MRPTFVRVAGAAALMMAAASLGLGVPGTLADDDDDEARFVYAAKVLCPQDEGPGEQVSIQNVTTSINVHNPQKKTVTFATKGIPLEDGQGPTPPGERNPLTLEPDWALQMACGELTVGTGGFGDLIIESPRELDVWAVYLTTDGSTVVETDVVRVPPTRRKG